jgi:3-(3-hydroxy-phenyl)propionate hydroxylase
MQPYDVIICGQGPVGLLAANLLAQRGHRVVTVEARERLNDQPRAVRIDHEAMRILQDLDLAEAAEKLMATTAGMDFVNQDGTYICGFRTTDMAAVSGWAFSYLFHQPDLEELLRNRLASTAVDQLHGWTLVDTVDEPDGEAIRCRLVSADGRTKDLEGRILIGADGARSTVLRTAVGGDVEDMGFDQSWLVVDALVRNVEPYRVVTQQVCDPARPATYIPGPGRHRRWEFMVLPDEDRNRLLESETINDLVRPWTDPDDLIFERTAVYEFHAVSPRRWRRGRAVIAGDAAHQTPPFLGQGLCAGFRDVANLCWKIGFVLTGRAPLSLLDTYGAERRPHFWEILQHAVRVGTIVGTLDEREARERDQEFLAALARGENALDTYRVPGLRSGVIGHSPDAGELMPQPRSDESGVLIDDEIGYGWRLFGVAHRVSALTRDDRRLLDLLAGSVVAVSGSVETQQQTEPPVLAGAHIAVRSGQLADFCNDEWVLVRPDHYIYDRSTDVAALLRSAVASVTGTATRMEMSQ